MKNLALFLALCYTTSIFAQNVYNLQNGALVDLLIVDEVSSENENNVSVQVAHDIIDSRGKVIIKGGTPVKFNIQRTKKSGVGKPGIIEITFLSVESIDNQFIKLNGKHSKEGKSNKSKALGVGLGVGLGTLLLPMLAFMAKKGEPAVINSNTIVNNVPVLGNYEIK